MVKVWALPPLRLRDFNYKTMKQKYILLSIFLIQGVWLFAQVGINNPNPNATLDVSGNVLVREKLFLEAPGSYSKASNSKLLVIRDVDNAVVKYDVAKSSYGPLNYVQFIFENTSRDGLRDGYDTKISASKYTLAVHGFSFKIASNKSSSVSFKSTAGTTKEKDQNMEGQQFYAYVAGGTWWIKGFVNNSQVYETSSAVNVDIYMNIMVYRNNFITKVWDGIEAIDMGKSPTKTVPLPHGF